MLDLNSQIIQDAVNQILSLQISGLNLLICHYIEIQKKNKPPEYLSKLQRESRIVFRVEKDLDHQEAKKSVLKKIFTVLDKTQHDTNIEAELDNIKQSRDIKESPYRESLFYDTLRLKMSEIDTLKSRLVKIKKIMGQHDSLFKKAVDSVLEELKNRPALKNIVTDVNIEAPWTLALVFKDSGILTISTWMEGKKQLCEITVEKNHQEIKLERAPALQFEYTHRSPEFCSFKNMKNQIFKALDSIELDFLGK